MAGGVKRHRRRTSYVALAVAVAALGVWASYALAGTDKGQVSLKVEYHTDPCASAVKRLIGTDTLKRSGDTLTVTHHVHGADPGNAYDLYVYDAGLNCGTSYYLGKFKVDGSGDGGRSGSVDVSGSTGQFVVCDYNNDTALYDCSMSVTLGKNQFSGTTTVTV